MVPECRQIFRNGDHTAVGEEILIIFTLDADLASDLTLREDRIDLVKQYAEIIQFVFCAACQAEQCNK